jgi:hypothetical protein
MKKQEIHLLGIAICLVAYDVYTVLKKMELVTGNFSGINIEVDKSENYPNFLPKYKDRVAILELVGVDPKIEILCRFYLLTGPIVDAEIHVNIKSMSRGTFEYLRHDSGSASFSSKDSADFAKKFVAAHMS